MGFSAEIAVTGSGLLQKSLDYSTPTETVAIGSLFPAAGFSLSDGNGPLQAQIQWAKKYTIAAGATQNIDLFGALTGGLGDPVSLVKVKTIVVAIVAPDGTKLIRVGPQNVANAAQLGFGGVGAEAYLETDTFAVLPRPYGGWAITAGTADLLPIKNPSGVALDVAVWAIGTNT